MSRATLESVIPAGATIVLDSSAVLAYLDGGEVVSSAAAVVIDDFVRTGRNDAIVSTVSVTEALVRPMRAGSDAAIELVEAFLRHYPNLRFEPVSHEIAREAARIRAATALRTPDATILATAAVLGAEVVVTNDGRWAPALERAGLTVGLCRLDEHVQTG